MNRRLPALGMVAIATVAACAAVLGPLAAGSATASPHPTPAATPVKTVIRAPVRAAMRHLHERKVRFASLSAKTRLALRAAGVTSSVIAVAEPNVLEYPSKCLDANNSGPTAGQNGDKVQLWGCFNDSVNHKNQWWIPVQAYPGWTELMSLQYANMCLDADNSGDFVDGAKVQLWHCINNQKTNPNQWWNFGPAGWSPVLSMWGDRSKQLDANDSGPTAGQNGDKVQVWVAPGDKSEQIWNQTLG